MTPTCHYHGNQSRYVTQVSFGLTSVKSVWTQRSDLVTCKGSVNSWAKRSDLRKKSDLGYIWLQFKWGLNEHRSQPTSTCLLWNSSEHRQPLQGIVVFGTNNKLPATVPLYLASSALIEKTSAPRKVATHFSEMSTSTQAHAIKQRVNWTIMNVGQLSYCIQIPHMSSF